MQGLAILTGATAIFLALVSIIKRQLLNSFFLVLISVASIITIYGISTDHSYLVAITHYLFIFLVYFGSVFVTEYALGFVAILSAVALFTRMYYNKCIFSEAYRETGDRNVLTDLTYIAPLIVIGIRIALGLATEKKGHQLKLKKKKAHDASE